MQNWLSRGGSSLYWSSVAQNARNAVADMSDRLISSESTSLRTRVDWLAWTSFSRCVSVRAGNHRFWLLSTLRAHTKAPWKTDLHRKTLRVLNRPGRARTVVDYELALELHPHWSLRFEFLAAP